MFAPHSSSVRVLLGIAALSVCPSVWATSADDAASRVVVPLVAYDKGFVTKVFATNHETRTFDAQVRYVGERSGPAPGLKVCGKVKLVAMTLTEIDIPAKCGLPADSGTGLVVLIELDPGVARISAYARIDVRSVQSGRTLQTLPVGGMPLAALDTTENVHVVGGLQQTAPPNARLMATDCAFATVFDGSGAGGVIVELALKDSQGVGIGSPRLFNLRPFELVLLKDVFKLLGVPQNNYLGVRAEFSPGGAGDAVLGYCTTAQEGQVKGDLSLALNVAQVANPQDEVRLRTISVGGTPALGSFLLMPQKAAHHGLYVRHPDRFTCSVAGSPELEITAVSPDGSLTVGGQGPKTPEIGHYPHGSIANGIHDLWGLEIRRGPAASLGPLPYTIHCDSGNGTSLADFLF